MSTLEKRIDSTRDVMNSELLSRIWYVRRDALEESTNRLSSSSTQAGNCRLEEGYANLHESIKQFIDRWSEGRRALSQLISKETQATRVHVTAEAELTRDRITLMDTRLASESSQRQLEETRNRLLSTLYFPEMNEREKNIEEASDDIAHEIFQKSKASDWLRSDAPVFWINGKPGSGKSTLVKCLIHHRRTIECLRTWKPSVKIFQFFFYELGRSSLQRKILGCVRTLLHQLLDEDPDVWDYLLQIRPGIERKISEHDWSLKELSDALFECLRHRNPAACLFVDGLDEIQIDEREAIVKLVESLRRLPNVKICVSCRPENIFRGCLESYPTLKVQDLNYDAMLSHADATLNGYKASLQVSEEDYQQLLSNLVRISEGVFLWAIMATKSLARGLANGDSWTLLKQRLDEFAPNLNELYRQMWHRQNADLLVYKRDAAKVFHYALYAPIRIRTWRHCLLATHQDLRKELQHLVTSKGYYTSEEDTRIRRQYERWLLARTAGLVEINSSYDFPASSVRFIHRSVLEFLKGTNDGQAIMGYDDRSTEEKLLTYLSVTRDAAHIGATMAQDYEGSDITLWGSTQDNYSMAIGMLILLRLKGVEDERLVDNLEWMPPAHQNPAWGQVLLAAAADAGDLTVLNQIHHVGGVFECISQQVKSQILYTCCERLSTRRWRSDLMIIDVWETANAIDEDQDELIISQFWLEGLLSRISCIEWLLKHGANPHMDYEYNLTKRFGSPIDNIYYINRTAFRLLISNVFLEFVLSSQRELLLAGAMRTYAEAIQGCVKALGECGSHLHDDTLILQPGYEHSFLLSLNPANILKFIDRLTSSPSPIDIPHILTSLMNPEIVHIHAVIPRRRGLWQRPSPTNDVEDIRKLDTLFLNWFLSRLNSQKKSGVGYRYNSIHIFSEGNEAGKQVVNFMAAMSWEDIQGADVELCSNIPNHLFERDEDGRRRT